MAGLEGLEPHYDFVIVGAGLSGFVFAEQAAARFGYTSLIIDKRDHIGAFPPGCAQLRLDMTRAKHDRVACALAGVRPCGGGTGGRKDTTLQVWGRVAEPLLALTPPPPVHHAGGNCFDFIDSHGIRVSQYGVHLFHTQARPPHLQPANCGGRVPAAPYPASTRFRPDPATLVAAPVLQSKRVWEYVNRWSEWMPYEHRCACLFLPGSAPGHKLRTLRAGCCTSPRYQARARKGS